MTILIRSLNLTKLFYTRSEILYILHSSELVHLKTSYIKFSTYYKFVILLYYAYFVRCKHISINITNNNLSPVPTFFIYSLWRY